MIANGDKKGSKGSSIKSEKGQWRKGIINKNGKRKEKKKEMKLTTFAFARARVSWKPKCFEPVDKGRFGRFRLTILAYCEDPS